MEGKGLEGILKWSLAQSDGTVPAKPVSEEDRKWFIEAMQSQQVDVAKRMKEVAAVMATPLAVLEEQGLTVEELEGLLEEVQEHVESIDNANDLQVVGGLQPLLSFLQAPQPPLRARAAEVVSTVVQNNAKSQESVMAAGGLEMLMANLESDTDHVSQTKALGAISSLIHHNKAGVQAFRASHGIQLLKEALQSDHPRFQRKALNVLRYLLQENSDDLKTASDLGMYPLLISLVTGLDQDVREAALRTLLHIASHSPQSAHQLTQSMNDVGTNASGTTGGGANASGTSGRLDGVRPLNARGGGGATHQSEDGKLANKVYLGTVLDKRMEAFEQLDGADLEALLEERNLLDSLWETCFKVPSRLRTGVAMIDKVKPVEVGIADRGTRGTNGGYSYVGEEMAERVGPPLMLGAP